MIKIIYSIKQSDKDKETAWLRNQGVFPSFAEYGKLNGDVLVGVIVSPESALAIKLRHKLENQALWKQR